MQHAGQKWGQVCPNTFAQLRLPPALFADPHMPSYIQYIVDWLDSVSIPT